MCDILLALSSLCNRLPASIVLADNTWLFKKLLKDVDFSYAMFGKAWY